MQPQNELVLENRYDQSGFRDYRVKVSARGLEELAESLRKLSAAGFGEEVRVLITEREGANSFCALSFEKCTDDEISKLQQPVPETFFERIKQGEFVGPILGVVLSIFLVGVVQTARFLFWALRQLGVRG